MSLHCQKVCDQQRKAKEEIEEMWEEEENVVHNILKYSDFIQ